MIMTLEFQKKNLQEQETNLSFLFLLNICLDSTSIRHDDAEYFYKHGVEGTTVFQNDRYLVCFNQTTGDLITGDKQRTGNIRKFNETNRIGSQTWIDKWSKK